jgi:hypothetical protein
MKKLLVVLSIVAISTSALADPLRTYRGPYGGDLMNRDIQSYQQPRDQIPLAALLQTGALIYSSQNAMKNNNPYAVLSVAGAATSIAPSLGYNQTLSSFINSFGKK